MNRNRSFLLSFLVLLTWPATKTTRADCPVDLPSPAGESTFPLPPATFQGWVNGIVGTGGADCPEASLTAARDAIEKVGEGGKVSVAAAC